MWYSTFWLIVSVVELVIGGILFVLPICEIIKLQLSVSRRLTLAFIFAIGGWWVPISLELSRPS